MRADVLSQSCCQDWCLMSLIIQTVYSQIALSLKWLPAIAVSWKIAPSSVSTWVCKSFFGIMLKMLTMLKMPFHHFSSSSQPGFTVCRTCWNWFPNSFVTFRLGNLIRTLSSHFARWGETSGRDHPAVTTVREDRVGFTIGFECRGEICA